MFHEAGTRFPHRAVIGMHVDEHVFLTAEHLPQGEVGKARTLRPEIALHAFHRYNCCCC